MAEVTEAQARRICLRLGLHRPETDRITIRDELTGQESFTNFGQPVWRIVQRAAADGGEK